MAVGCEGVCLGLPHATEHTSIISNMPNPNQRVSNCVKTEAESDHLSGKAPLRDGHDSLLVKGHLKEHVADDGHGDLGQVCAKQECG